MANLTDVKQSLKKVSPAESLMNLVEKSAKELGKALPSHLNPERIVRIAFTCIRLNPKLSACTQESFLGALFTSAQLGIEPIAGRGYLLPFQNKGILECQFVLGYKGLIDLFYRHDNSLVIDMQTVKEKDCFEFQYGTNAKIIHKPAITNRGETIGYYAIAKLKGGESVFKFMSVDEILDHAKRHSKSFDKKMNDFVGFSPWKNEFDAMAMKTVLIQLSKMLPLSVELQRAISSDETSRDYRKGIDNVLDLPDKTEWKTDPEVEEVVNNGKNNNKKITQQQIARLMAIANESGLNEEKVNSFIFDYYGCNSKKDILDKDYEEIVGVLRTLKP